MANAPPVTIARSRRRRSCGRGRKSRICRLAIVTSEIQRRPHVSRQRGCHLALSVEIERAAPGCLGWLHPAAGPVRTDRRRTYCSEFALSTLRLALS